MRLNPAFMVHSASRTLRLLPFLSLFLLPAKGSAQITEILVQVDSVLYGYYQSPCGPIDLTGYVNYEVYLCIQDPNDCFVGVLGGCFDALDNCSTTDLSNLSVTFDGSYYNDPLGSAYGSGILCNLCAQFPTLCFDTWAALNDSCTAAPPFEIGCPNDIGPNDVWGPSSCGNQFGTTDIFIDNGGWFQPFIDGDVPNNGKYLIAQITTNDQFCIDGCISLQNNCQNGTANILLDTLLMCQQNPCLAFPMDVSPQVVVPLCSGPEVYVAVEDGGFGPVTYQVHQSNGTIYEAFVDGDGFDLTLPDANGYYITMIDSVGCRDTSATFNILTPVPLTFQTELISDIACFGDLTGSISTICTGGTGTLDVTLDPQSNNNPNQVLPCGSTFTGLGCGSYLLTVADDNNCQLDTTISVSCPAAIDDNIVINQVDCFGICEGGLSGNLSGGTGTLQFTWTYCDGNTVSGSGTGTFSISQGNLCACDSYLLEVVDDSLCTYTNSFEVTQPQLLEATSIINDVSCAGICDGSIQINTTGGTGTIDINCENSNGVPLSNFNNLCADTYYCTIVDDNQCTLQDTLILEPQNPIYYTMSHTDVTCFADCDGSIEVIAEGGVGDFSFAISPGGGILTTPNDSTALYQNVCANNYTVTITDGAGCSIDTDDINVTQPAELEIHAVVSEITCFGDNNGVITISCSGGTNPIQITSPGIMPCPSTFSDLPPASYSYTITDGHDCTADTTIVLDEPDLLVVSITDSTMVSCGGQCDGVFSGTFAGGTAGYSYVLLPLNQTGPIAAGAFDFDDLCADSTGYFLTIIDANGCMSSDSTLILEPPPIDISVSEHWVTCTGMCDGSVDVFVDGGTGDLEINFDPDNLLPILVPGSDPEHYQIFELCEGDYFVTVTDEAGCSDSENINIEAEIITDMILTVFTSPETCWNEMDGTATIAVQNGNLPISVQWNDPDLQTTWTAVGLASNELYSVTVTDSIGCTLTTTAYVEPTIGCFFIATALTPNGDGVNDEWLIGGLEYFPDAVVQVFNRWGQLLFESKGYNAPWDGRFKGNRVPMADYYFVIDYSADNEPITGAVTVKY